MLRVSPEQHQLDQEIVDSYTADYASRRAYGEWELRYRAALGRIDNLYEEFVPDVDPQARMLGSMLGAGVMAFIEMRYGPSEDAPKFYSGLYETDVLSIHHNASHSWEFMRNEFRYAVVKNQQMGLDDEGCPYYDDEYFLRAPLIAASHDGILGNRRRNDERQSALFGGRLMMRVGGTLLPDARVMAAIEATTWDDEHQQQLVYQGEDHTRYRVAAKVADLLNCNDKIGVYESVGVHIENMTKRFRHRLLSIEAERRRFDLIKASMPERMEFIDSSDVLRRCMGESLDSQVNMLKQLAFADPSVESEFPGRLENAAFTDYLRCEYNAKVIDGPKLLQDAKDYAGIAA